ncbi:hypothetical protein AMECASPLE_039320, partial [Ameca splendens]
STPWKLFYIVGCLFVALQNMEEWEEAVFDKTKQLIELKTISLYSLVLTLWRKGQETRRECAIPREGLSCHVEVGCWHLLPSHPECHHGGTQVGYLQVQNGFVRKKSQHMLLYILLQG